MASAIRQMTSVGGDIRKIARLLQKKAPPGHMLAYINQEEADLLKARGGSGEPHADTGVPSFAEEDYVPDYSPTSQYTGGSYGDAENLGTVQYAAPERTGYTGITENLAARVGMDYSPSSQFNLPQQGASAAPAIDLGQSFSDADIAAVGDRFKTPAELGFYPGGSEAPTPQDKDLLGQAANWFSNLGEDTKKRLGIASIQGLMGAYQSQQAAEQGRKAKEEMQRMAQPYQQQGKRLIEQAQRGELSPVGQQQLQAVQAQAAQGAQARGGVGAQQAQAQVEAYRQQLLQGQYDLGLKVSGIGDNIAMGAIKTGLEADRYVNQLTSNYFTNIARTAYGQAPQVAGSPTYGRAE
jgi:hypothetical protein